MSQVPVGHSAMSRDESLAVIAACLALPIVEKQLASINQARPTGNVNMELVTRRRLELDAEARPWIARRDQFLDAVRGGGV